jgi:stringent starvation protein B
MRDIKTLLKLRLLQAYLIWAWDRNAVPYLTIYTPKGVMPYMRQYVHQDVLTLNLAAGAITKLKFDEENNEITFGARFNGRHVDIAIPVDYVVNAHLPHEQLMAGYESTLVWDPQSIMEMHDDKARVEQLKDQPTPDQVEVNPVKRPVFSVVK